MNADKTQTPSANPRTKRFVGMLAVLLMGTLIAVAVLWVRGLTTAAAGDGRPVAHAPALTVKPSTAQPISPGAPPAESTTAGQSAAAAVENNAAAPSGQLPGSCDQLYSTALVDTLTAGNLALNPARLNDPDVNVTFGPADEHLRTVIDANESLQCIWVTPAGGSGIGIGTTVVLVDAAERDQVADRLRSLGFVCVNEREGLRCDTETSSVEGTFGESHFLRDDLWVATQYGDVPLPKGYTLDIIDSLWPLGK
jgi:hypothetical protein